MSTQIKDALYIALGFALLIALALILFCVFNFLFSLVGFKVLAALNTVTVMWVIIQLIAD